MADANVTIKLMEDCESFSPRDWNAYPDHFYGSKKEKAAKQAAWDGSKERCNDCGTVEDLHHRRNPRMTVLGKELAEFLEHFYGLKPREL